MRRSDREVTDLRQQLEIIQRCDSCCLAMHDAQAETPYLIELSFGMEHADGKTTLYFHSAKEGKKLDLIRQDARVSFFMSCGHALIYDEAHQMCTMNYESVSGQGIMRMLSGSEAMHGLDVLMAHYYPDAHKGYDARTAAVTAVYGLEIRSMTAKKREKKI